MANITKNITPPTTLPTIAPTFFIELLLSELVKLNLFGENRCVGIVVCADGSSPGDKFSGARDADALNASNDFWGVLTYQLDQRLDRIDEDRVD